MIKVEPPFKLFEVSVEEEITKNVTMMVIAESKEDLKGIASYQFVDHLSSHDWDDDSDGPRVWKIKESEEKKCDPEEPCQFSGFRWKGEWITKQKFDEIMEETRRSNIEKRLPFPGQLGLPGIADDIPLEEE